MRLGGRLRSGVLRRHLRGHFREAPLPRHGNQAFPPLRQLGPNRLPSRSTRQPPDRTGCDKAPSLFPEEQAPPQPAVLLRARKDLLGTDHCIFPLRWNIDVFA
jgi:hypothetical protein